ncbi:MAG: FAD:protein FMN transferase [Bacteroidota bacterium]
MNKIFSLSLILLFLAACQQDDTPQLTIIQGETMGTYYRVTYLGVPNESLQASIDSLLVVLNDEVSTYIPTSLISRFSHGDLMAIDTETFQTSTHFKANYLRSLEIAEATAHYFNPTVMPLVNYWGFGYTPKRAVTDVDSVAIDSLMQFVGMEKVEYYPDIIAPSAVQIMKRQQGTQLDFSAIAKGYGVDLIAAFLEGQGIANYLVDIGGESVARGDKGGADKPWVLAINTPRADAAITDYEVAVALRDAALATSGNYRNFHEVEGGKYGHTINPFTGYPELSRLLSASILAPDCTTADAYATASMVAGLEAAYTMVDTTANLEGLFIFGTEDGTLQMKMTPGFEQHILD